MRKLKFSHDEGSAFYKELIEALDDHFTKRGYRKEGNHIMRFKIGLYFGLVLVSYAGVLSASNVVKFSVFYLLLGLAVLLTAFNVSHDAAHGVAVKSKFWNKILFHLSFQLQGNNAYVWGKNHTESHHLYTNVEGSDSLYWVFIKDFVIYASDKANLQRTKITYHLSFWIQKITYVTYLLILPLIFSYQSGWHTALAFLSMHLVQSLFLLFTFFITHHVEQTAYFDTDNEGRICTSWLTNQVWSSNDFYPFSKLANFIFGGFNNHIAHHLYPTIHHIHYPRLNQILYKVLNENHIKPNETTYFGGIVSHLRHLKNMSQIGFSVTKSR